MVSALRAPVSDSRRFADGYRLPLDSLPWVAPEDYPHVYEPDPLRRRGRRCRSVSRHVCAAILWTRTAATVRTCAGQPDPPSCEQVAPRPGDSAKGIVRTAICVEPRHGRLHIFMPPVNAAEDYLDLIAAIEETAARARHAGDHRRLRRRRTIRG